MSEEKTEPNMNSFRKKKKVTERERGVGRETERKKERIREVPMSQGIELISVDSALWRLQTINNSFIIPTQEIQFSWGKY